MTTVLGVNAVFHDPAAALVVDGTIVAAAEEERFNRRKHGKDAVPFSTWELPVEAMRWCLAAGDISPEDLDAVAYSYDPTRAEGTGEDLTRDEWEGLRTLFVQRAPRFLETALPGLAAERVRHVPHHVAHAASAHLASPHPSSAVLVVDGRGERSSHLAGHAREDGSLEVLASTPLPDSIGLLYEAVTEHLGFRRSSDEYKVMALASYGEPAFASAFREATSLRDDGSLRTDSIDLGALVPCRAGGDPIDAGHAALASSLQERVEELLVEAARWLGDRTGERALTMAGGVALNCVANSRILADGPFDEVWVQPAAGDAGTALGASLRVACDLGDRVEPMSTAALGRGWTDREIEDVLGSCRIAHEVIADDGRLAAVVAEAIASGAVVGWFQGRSEFGPRALGNRSFLADPRDADNLRRLNDVKGREQFRPIAPMVLAEWADEIFDGPRSSPYMLFVHRVRPDWVDRIPAVVHVDGTARAQTVDRRADPMVAAVLDAFHERTGVPVLVNTSFNTAGRPMVDDPRHALECFASSPMDLLVLGHAVVRRTGWTQA